MASLEPRVWRNKHLKLETKLLVYRTLVLPVLLYNCEAWTLLGADLAKLDAFDSRCLRRILNIHWSDRVTNVVVRQRAGQEPVSRTIRRRRLRLFGHIARLPSNTPAYRILDELILRPRFDGSWSRPPGGVRLVWLDGIRADILPHSLITVWKRTTRDRVAWHGFVSRKMGDATVVGD